MWMNSFNMFDVKNTSNIDNLCVCRSGALTVEIVNASFVVKNCCLVLDFSCRTSIINLTDTIGIG